MVTSNNSSEPLILTIYKLAIVYSLRRTQSPMGPACMSVYTRNVQVDFQILFIVYFGIIRRLKSVWYITCTP